MENVNVEELYSHKNDIRLHGFGIMNMKTIAEKYSGEVTLSCNDNEFTTLIFLKNVKD